MIVDNSLSRWFSAVTELSLEMLMKLGVVVLISPVFLFPGAFIGALGAWVGELYMKAQLAVKRERSNAKAPVLGHLGAAFTGLSTSPTQLTYASSTDGDAQPPFAHTAPRRHSGRNPISVSTDTLVQRESSSTLTSQSSTIGT